MTFSEKHVLVKPDTKVSSVMEQLQHNGHGLCIVVDPNKKIMGTITDGDCRRAVLKEDGALEARASEVMNTRFIAAHESFPMDSILQLMKVNSIDQVPIVDDTNRVSDLVSLRSILQENVAIDNPVVILAGGKGTRMRPYTDETPKPMLHVAGKPMLERTIERLVSQGFNNIFISINYLGQIIKDYFDDGSKYGCKIQYLEETEELGTAAPLRLLPTANKPILMLNGDLVTTLNFKSMLDLHTVKENDLTVGVSEYKLEIPFGVIEIADDLTLTKLEEKPVLSKLINAGVYIVKPELIHLIPEAGFFPITDLMSTAMADGRKVCAFPIHEFWRDIGLTEQYEAMQSVLK